MGTDQLYAVSALLENGTDCVVYVADFDSPRATLYSGPVFRSRVITRIPELQILQEKISAKDRLDKEWFWKSEDAAEKFNWKIRVFNADDVDVRYEICSMGVATPPVSIQSPLTEAGWFISVSGSSPMWAISSSVGDAKDLFCRYAERKGGYREGEVVFGSSPQTGHLTYSSPWTRSCGAAVGARMARTPWWW